MDRLDLNGDRLRFLQHQSLSNIKPPIKKRAWISLPFFNRRFLCTLTVTNRYLRTLLSVLYVQHMLIASTLQSVLSRYSLTTSEATDDGSYS